MKTNHWVASLALTLSATAAVAQERVAQAETNRPSESIRPIDPSNIMYKVTNWRQMDLNELQNQPFFSKNNEITKYLIEGVRAGLLEPYTSDSLTTKMTLDQFNLRLQYENTDGGLSEEEKAAGFTEEGAGGADDGWGDSGAKKKEPAAKKPAAGTDSGWGDPSTDTTSSTSSGAIEYFPQEMTLIEIKEDYIFDKQRSRPYFDIQSLTLYIPAAKTSRGFNVPVASFRYKDVDKYFRSQPSKFIWYNSQNQAKHLNMADAFDLRLFSARLIKQSNARDAFLEEVYGGPRQGLVKSQQLEHKLMEWEHNLWEY
jgi:hypothetical protein